MADGRANGSSANRSKVNKITLYFPFVKKEKHCFVDCKFGRSDETDGDMTLCDGCTVWFHNTCIDDNAKKHPVRPRPRPSDEESEPTSEVWFCPSCRIAFTDLSDIKEELETLRELFQDILHSKKDERPIDLPEFSGSKNKAQTSGKKGSLSEMQREISQLKDENNALKSRLESTALFPNQALDDQTSRPVSNMSRTPYENDQAWQKVTRNNNKRGNKKGNRSATQSSDTNSSKHDKVTTSNANKQRDKK